MPWGSRFGLQGQDKDILNDMGPRDANTMPIHANSIDNTRGRPPEAAAPVSSIPLVFLGRLVLVMHLTLIGYAIGYFQNQDPHGYPGLLI